MTNKDPGPIKIFSMEADQFFRLFLEDALVVFNPRDVEITFSSSLEDFLDKISKNLPEVPDVIFLSVTVPKAEGKGIDLRGGFTALKILRSNKAFQKVPIIMFSKHGEKRLMKKAKALGVTRYLVKGECMPRDIANVVACADKMHMSSFKSLYSWIKK